MNRFRKNQQDNLYSGLLRTFQVALILIILGSTPLYAQESDDCFACHEDSDFTTEINGKEISLHVDPDRYANSIHADLECIDCHSYLDGIDDFPHEEEHQIVECGNCHDDISERYDKSLHGQAVHSGKPFAPQCWDCHGNHYITKISDANSAVEKFKIPQMCGKCHKEGTDVTRTYEIPQDSILSHYSLSIHGEGLFSQGLTVTAVCSDCHTSHDVLPHTDPKSSIHRDNIANTCQQCHGRIVQVHQKVIKGELWEQDPDKIPICVDCHEPHEVRRVFYNEVADKECLKCHSDESLTMTRDSVEISLYVDSLEAHSSIHKGTTCAQCHTGISPRAERPCSTVGGKVDCGICHSEVVDVFATGMHGMLVDRGDPDAPHCIDCHGTHTIREHKDPKSTTFPTNVPDLCGKCHVKNGKAVARRLKRGEESDADSYVMSIHGKGLLESGLVVTAMCSDCHTPHRVLPKSDPASSVHPANLAQTCATCHNGIYEKFMTSVHAAKGGENDDKLPGCADCHQSHTIMRTDSKGFQQQVLNQCGKCHKELTESYFETFHGKVFQLGATSVAECHDCHGSHTILPTDDPNSTLSRQNIVETCGQCHEGSHRKFAGYLTHATHHDKDKYPILYYTFWFMTTLLIGTLIIAVSHTLLWLPRSLQAMKQHKKMRAATKGNRVYRRFTRQQSILHVIIVVSFLGLAITGMILKFSYAGWAQWLSSMLGGFESAGFIHRFCAFLTGIYFGTHIYSLFKQKVRENISFKHLLFGPDSIVPNKRDLNEVINTIKWFFGFGTRPDYGRWTYWEKFDYFAVFWGVLIIGSTGLVLWFPLFFTRFMPGWIINVATIVHSDEALLATAFIFTVHFFNTHFRPDKFPMDTVIFTGRMSVDELKHERPREYRELVEKNELDKYLIEPLPLMVERGIRIFGATALTFGVILILLVIYAEVFAYK